MLWAMQPGSLCQSAGERHSGGGAVQAAAPAGQATPPGLRVLPFCPSAVDPMECLIP